MLDTVVHYNLFQWSPVGAGLALHASNIGSGQRSSSSARTAGLQRCCSQAGDKNRCDMLSINLKGLISHKKECRKHRNSVSATHVSSATRTQLTQLS
jgi:hypothetical protein